MIFQIPLGHNYPFWLYSFCISNNEPLSQSYLYLCTRTWYFNSYELVNVLEWISLSKNSQEINTKYNNYKLRQFVEVRITDVSKSNSNNWKMGLNMVIFYELPISIVFQLHNLENKKYRVLRSCDSDHLNQRIPGALTEQRGWPG